MKKFNGKIVKTLALLATIFTAGALSNQVSASEETASPISASVWVARTPEQIKADITGNEYTIVWGDTLSAISKATNITIERLAQWNNIYNIDLIYAGNKLVFDGNVVSLKDAEGNTISQAVIQDTDKIDPTKPIGGGSNTNPGNSNNGSNVSTKPTPPATDNGSGDGSTKPTPPATDNGSGDGSTKPTPPATDNGSGGDNGSTNPPADREFEVTVVAENEEITRLRVGPFLTTDEVAAWLLENYVGLVSDLQIYLEGNYIYIEFNIPTPDNGGATDREIVVEVVYENSYYTRLRVGPFLSNEEATAWKHENYPEVVKGHEVHFVGDYIYIEFGVGNKDNGGAIDREITITVVYENSYYTQLRVGPFLNTTEASAWLRENYPDVVKGYAVYPEGDYIYIEFGTSSHGTGGDNGTDGGGTDVDGGDNGTDGGGIDVDGGDNGTDGGGTDVDSGDNETDGGGTDVDGGDNGTDGGGTDVDGGEDGSGGGETDINTPVNLGNSGIFASTIEEANAQAYALWVQGQFLEFTRFDLYPALNANGDQIGYTVNFF
ncbi:LysM peptidoglycan-binding domain-containing protein [Enterococcus casseliflavus]|jgi:LysM repeat protein|uniref:LysM peptidoglycan-binding domain-containing protein n=1 Tax=Enterococcus casseliflavus TaxID=37734 RepID=UPI000FFCA213|nr:LysM domain-containing protein [Enterococcus casseliflavus]RXA64784.1 LysM peptidoglycan-binding domain-containing protein [Enterococcus casseliflavus]